MKTNKSFSLIVSIFFICFSCYSDFAMADVNSSEDVSYLTGSISEGLSLPVSGSGISSVSTNNNDLDSLDSGPVYQIDNLSVVVSNPGEVLEVPVIVPKSVRSITKDSLFSGIKDKIESLKDDSFDSVENIFGEIFISKEGKQYLNQTYNGIKVKLFIKSEEGNINIPTENKVVQAVQVVVEDGAATSGQGSAIRLRRSTSETGTGNVDIPSVPVVPIVDEQQTIIEYADRDDSEFKLITDVTADEWVKIVGGKYGLVLLDSSGKKKKLIIDDNNLIDIDISDKTLRNKLQYYGVTAGNLISDNEIHARSISDFKVAVLNQLDLLEYSIGDVSGFIQSNDELKSLVKDKKVGITIGNQKYAVIPMLDGKESPFIDYLISELFKDLRFIERFGKKIKKYSDDEALIRFFEFNKDLNGIGDITQSSFRDSLENSIIDNIPLGFANSSFTYGSGSINSIFIKDSIENGKNKYTEKRGSCIDFRKISTPQGSCNYLSEYLRKQIVGFADNGEVTSKLEENNLFRNAFLTYENTHVYFYNIFSDLKSIGFDDSFNKVNDNKEYDGIALLNKQLKLDVLKNKVRKRELNAINLGSKNNQRLRIAAWLSDNDINDYVANNSDELMKLLIKDATFISSFKDQLNVSDSSRALKRIRDFISSNGSWFSTEESLFKINGEGHLISSKSLYDYIKPTFFDSLFIDISNGRKSARYREFFTAAKVDWLLLDINSNGNKKFVYENGPDSFELGAGRGKLVEFIEDQDSGITNDDFESLVLQNPNFVKLIISNGSKVKLRNFVKAQKSERSEIIFDDILDGINFMNDLVGKDHDYSKLEIEFGNDLYKDQINVEYIINGSAEKDPRVMTYFRQFIKKGINEHPLFSSFGKKVVLNSINSRKIEKITKDILNGDKYLSEYVLPVRFISLDGNSNPSLVTSPDSWDSGNINDQISVEELINNSQFSNLSDSEKKKLSRFLVERSVKDRGLYSDNFSKSINFVNFLSYVLSDKDDLFRNDYRLYLGAKNIFNDEFNVFSRSLNTSISNDLLGISIGFRGFSSSSDIQNIKSNVKGIIFDSFANGFYSLNSDYNVYLQSSINYLISNNSFASKNRTSRYLFDGSAILSSIRYGNKLTLNYTGSKYYDLSSSLGLSLGRARFNSYDYDLSEFNRYFADSSLGVSAKYKIDYGLASYKAAFSGLIGRDFIKNQYTYKLSANLGCVKRSFNFNAELGINYYNGEFVYGYGFSLSYGINY